MRASRVAASYERARRALLSEAAGTRGYDAGAAYHERRRQVTAATARATAAYAVIRREGSERDRALVADLAARNSRYLNAVIRMLEAPRTRDAQAIRANEVQPLFRSLSAQTSRAISGARREALAGAAAVHRPERVALVAMPLALVLAALLALVGRTRIGRRRDSAAQAHVLRLERAALTDNHTGLGNHRAFHEDLDRAIEHRSRFGSWFSLLMLDLDGLKQINDTLGHQVGDERLKALVELVRGTIRETDGAYRMGGDEFVVILPGVRAWGGLGAASRLEVAAASAGVVVSGTIGIAETIALESKHTLIKRADLALYEAKRSHRKIVIYSDGLDPSPRQEVAESESPHLRKLATALARAVDAKDAGTRTHCETVSELCVLVGEELGLGPERIAGLRVAGLLHDVGKIGISDSILQKAGALDEGECEEMRTHPIIGDNIVAATELSAEARWIRHHHERFDGAGYPDGLRGDEIPLESRIILVADAFEAITADRPYRAGRSPGKAVLELERHSGTQFDPQCVRALRRVVLGSADERVVEEIAAA